MLLRDLSKVYISEYTENNDHGERTKTWEYKGRLLTVEEVNEMTGEELNATLVMKLLGSSKRGIAYLNMQQDVNELDRKSTGEVDYEIYKGRSTVDYGIEKGNGISFTDISKSTDFKPEYYVLDKNKVGNTYTYRMEIYK